MEARKYPLEQLQVIKKKKLEDAEKVLKEKKEILQKEQESLEGLEKERDKSAAHRLAKLTQLREKLDEGTRTDKIQQMREYLKIVDEELKQKESKVQQQKKKVEAAEAEVEAARKELFKRHQDVEKLGLHYKEWEKEQHTALERREALEADETGSAMHTIRKKEKKSRKRSS